ncbi:unnamed protein product [Brachionus calyciflorus]|uniref:Uncharacterized protein n=1 Tax=Brachionus calyciflorus TaxID=104777 RepID=A0A813Q8E4_9BILA|nr:unnamed protein product [Brachionus calyciflorus]
MSDSEDEIKSKNLKIVLIGDGSSGKTSISTRYSQDQFERQYNQTLGIDFFMKRITLPGPTQVTLSVHDIGGQTLGGAMLDKYLFGADAVLLVYDITNYSSFENLDDWYQTAMKYCANKKVYFALVANKCDLEHLRAVKHEKHVKYSKEKDLQSFSVSAKSGESVNTMFQQIAAQILGITLSRIQVEDQHRVVKAEIVKPREVRPPKPVQKKSSICSIQ